MRHLVDSKEVEINQMKISHKEQLELYKMIYKDSGYREAEQVYQEKATRYSLLF